MWHSGVSGLGSGGARFAPDAPRAESTAVAPVAQVAAVRQLLNELFDATQTSKTQTAQGLRDKLNEHREKLGDPLFKGILNKLIETLDAYLQFQAFLRQLMTLLFPDTEATPSAPPALPGGGGPGRRVDRTTFPTTESMSNKPLTKGAHYFDYKPGAGEPGKRPGIGREAGNVWSGFSQGPDGNCVTVSAIKAAMMKFGQKPTDVFSEVKEAGNGYDVTMRDGKSLHLSKGELKQAAREARFKGDDPQMITDANFMYAVSAKRAQLEGNGLDDNINEAKKSYAHALHSLNNGEMPHEALDRLGLQGLYRRSSSSELASGKLGVVAYDHHSMAVIGGRVELWGQRGAQPKQGIAYAFH